MTRRLETLPHRPIAKAPFDSSVAVPQGELLMQDGDYHSGCQSARKHRRQNCGAKVMNSGSADWKLRFFHMPLSTRLRSRRLCSSCASCIDEPKAHPRILNVRYCRETVIMPYRIPNQQPELGTPEDVRTLRETLEAIEVIASQGKTPEELLPLLNIVHCGSSLTTPCYDPGTLTIYRAVDGTQKPFSKSRVSFPPAQYVKKNGRLNAAGESLFYGSVGQAASVFYECRAKAGDIFALGCWQNTGRVLLNHMGYSDVDINSNLPGRIWQNWMHPDVVGTRNEVLHSWQSRVFTRNVAPGEEHLYNLSIALARFGMDTISPSIEDPTRPAEMAGVLYPSVALSLQADNVALRPSVIASSFELLQVQLVRVRGLPEVRNPTGMGQEIVRVEAEILDLAPSHRNDGRLIWNRESTALSVTPYFPTVIVRQSRV
jgi:hypothetical protein